jgi:DNA-binding response OmpR family regulator
MEEKKILIVDDERDFGMMMKTFFSKKKCTVFLANSIAEGLDILEKERPDHVFLDNNLPDGLGWGKTEFILHNYPQTRLHLISVLDVPKTSATSFSILYKPTLTEELPKLFGW